ncbi:mediator of RNA polymerase II transcription subunit 15-like [Aphis craccivora]|uniref:Mediator of RNA polymerase II transcription subunit 15-like n=1 Tax=Aphis craccivora TaxID=307492 RepID=A0A6G0Y9C1_APHCR|nr:mediator of RNA polymerase II transcription subunit 15-like [Aphis craccivora]
MRIHGQMYCENHISKTQAKQKVGEIILRTMLAKELTGRTAETASTSTAKGPSQEDLPWLNFASLAMHYLINQWE